MDAAHPVPRRDVLVARWVARGLSAALFLIWGAFFVNHLGEWFVTPGAWPPPFVFLMQGLHGLMLLGFLVGWKWEVTAALCILAGSLPYCWLAVGSNYLLFTLAPSLPALLWLYTGLSSRRG